MTSREDELVRKARSGIDTDEELSAIFGEPVRRTKVRSYGPHDVSEEQVKRAATPVPADEPEESESAHEETDDEPAEEASDRASDDDDAEGESEASDGVEEPHEDYEVSEEELAEMDQEFDDFDDPTDDGIPYGANNYDEYYEVEVAPAPDEEEEEEYDEPAYYPEEKEEKEDEAFDSFTRASEPELVTHSDFTFDPEKVKGGVPGKTSRPDIPTSVIKALRCYLGTVIGKDNAELVTTNVLITSYFVATLTLDRKDFGEHINHVADAFLAADSLSSRLFTVVDRQSDTIRTMEQNIRHLDSRSKKQMTYFHELELGLAYLLATSTGEVSMMDVTPKNMRINRDETKQALNRLRIEGRDAK